LTRSKRLLLGTNRDESALFLGPHPQHSVTSASLANLTLEQFEPVADRYRTLYPAMSEELRRIRSVTAEEYWIPSLRVADAHVTGGGEAFVYRLDLPGEGRFAGLAFHSYDLRFVWDYFAGETPPPVTRQLAASMHNAWASFIRGDSPSAAALPAWTAYNLDKRPTMIFDQSSHIDFSPSAAEFKLWDGLLMN
jgi:para-nitrobenzyl esterase